MIFGFSALLQRHFALLLTLYHERRRFAFSDGRHQQVLNELSRLTRSNARM